MTNQIVSQGAALAVVEDLYSGPRLSQFQALATYAPRQTTFVDTSQSSFLTAGATPAANMSVRVSQAVGMMAYGTGVPNTASSQAWTFVLDGHRFYVLPLGPEGDWAYDTTTQEWCHLQTQGFPGLNFGKGVMWGMRIIGGDVLYTYLYELDPTQGLDEQWREVEHLVTGGIPTRTRSVTGVANFTVTASVGDETADDMAISLAYSDDNGLTWSEEFDIPLTNSSTQQLIWNSLGSFAAPGRVFRITDYSGPIRLDGADVVLTVGSGADSGQDSDGQRAQ